MSAEIIDLKQYRKRRAWEQLKERIERGEVIWVPEPDEILKELALYR